MWEVCGVGRVCGVVGEVCVVSGGVSGGEVCVGEVCVVGEVCLMWWWVRCVWCGGGVSGG